MESRPHLNQRDSSLPAPTEEHRRAPASDGDPLANAGCPDRDGAPAARSAVLLDFPPDLRDTLVAFKANLQSATDLAHRANVLGTLPVIDRDRTRDLWGERCDWRTLQAQAERHRRAAVTHADLVNRFAAAVRFDGKALPRLIAALARDGEFVAPPPAESQDALVELAVLIAHTPTPGPAPAER